MARPKEWEVYLYGTIAVLVVSGMSFVGAATIPFMRKRGFNMIMIFFMALAVGTMAADSLLHLIPQIIGLEGHSHGGQSVRNSSSRAHASHASTLTPFHAASTHSTHSGHGHSHDGHSHKRAAPSQMTNSLEASGAIINGHESEQRKDAMSGQDVTMKLIVALLSLYGFYLFDSLSKLYTLRIRRKMKAKDKVAPAEIKDNTSSQKVLNGHANGLGPPTGSMDTVIKLEEGMVKRDTEGNVMASGPEIVHQDSTSTIYAAQTMQLEDGREYQVFTGHQHSAIPDVEFIKKAVDEDKTICGMKPVVFMIIFGGALHNFADGLALGASFAANVKVGISTTIALICHEVPHELGDFAVLLNTGLSVKKALFLNGMSAVPAIVGLYVAIGLSLLEGVLPWIFAVVLGTFIYISLVAILNEIREIEPERTIRGFLLSNGGLLVGGLILALIAIYEEDIHL
jgi:zinc transporter ZupT